MKGSDNNGNDNGNGNGNDGDTRCCPFCKSTAYRKPHEQSARLVGDSLRCESCHRWSPRELWDLAGEIRL